MLVDREDLVVKEQPGAEARHTVPRILEAEQQVRRDVPLRPFELLGRDPLRGDRVELGQDEIDDLGGVVRRRSDRDDEGAAVGESGPLRDDRVGEAALLTDLLEQPRRDPAAEHVVEEREGETARVPAGRGPHAEHEVRLLRVPDGHVEGADLVRRRGPPRRAAPGDAGEAALETFGDAFVVDLAGRGDDDVRRAVVLGEEPADLVDGHRLDHVGVAEHLTPERVGGEQRARRSAPGRSRRARRGA